MFIFVIDVDVLAVYKFMFETEVFKLAVVKLILEILISTLSDLLCKFDNLLLTDVVYVCKVSNLRLTFPLKACNATTDSVNDTIDAVMDDADIYKLAVASFNEDVVWYIFSNEDVTLAVNWFKIEIELSILPDFVSNSTNLLSTDVEYNVIFPIPLNVDALNAFA